MKLEGPSIISGLSQVPGQALMKLERPSAKSSILISPTTGQALLQLELEGQKANCSVSTESLSISSTVIRS